MEKIETNIFDKETIYTNCVVQILENSITGECSVGWYATELTQQVDRLDDIEDIQINYI